MDILPIVDNASKDLSKGGKASNELNSPSSGPMVRSPSFIPPPVGQQGAQAIPIIDPAALQPSAQSSNSSPSVAISVTQPSASFVPSPVVNTPTVVSTVIPSVSSLPTPPVSNIQSTVLPTNSDSSQSSDPTPTVPGSKSIPNLAQPPLPSSSTTSPSPGLVGSFNLTNDPATNQIVTISIWAGVGLIIFIGIIACIRRINQRNKLSSNNLLFRPNDFGPTPPMTRSATTVTNGGMKPLSGSYAVSAADLNEAIRIEKEALREEDEQQRAAAVMAAGLMMSHTTSPPQQHGGVYVLPNNITGNSSHSTNSIRPSMLVSTQPPQPAAAAPTGGVMSNPVNYRPMYYNHPDTVQYNNNSSHGNPIPLNSIPLSGSSKPMYMPVSTSSPYMMPAMMGTPVLANGLTTHSSSIIIGGGGNTQYLTNQGTGEAIQHTSSSTHPNQMTSMMTGTSVISSSSPPSSSLPIPSSTHMDNIRHRIVNVPTGKVQYHNKRRAPEAPIPLQVGSGFSHSSSTYDLANNEL